MAVSTEDPEGAGGPELPPPGLFVLVAEDSLTSRMVARSVLTKLGCRSTEVADGEAAVAAWERESPALILMDCQMPGMDGFAATRAIRLREVGRSATPILALTASTEEEEWVRCFEAGMDGCILKPISGDALGPWLCEWGNPDRWAAIDPSHWERIVRDIGSIPDPTLFGRLMAAFRQEIAEVLAVLERSGSDPVTQRKALHKLHGCAASVGGMRVAAFAAELGAMPPGPGRRAAKARLLREVTRLREEIERAGSVG